MKQTFHPQRFPARSRAILNAASRILEDAAAQGYALSLRQLSYRLVAARRVANTHASFERVGELLSAARMAGILSWTGMADHAETAFVPTNWASPKAFLETAAARYRLDRWTDQPHYVEVIASRPGLGGVLIPVCDALDIPFTTVTGATPDTVMHAIGSRLQKRFRERMSRLGHMPARFENVRTLDYVRQFVADHFAEALESDFLDRVGEPVYRWDATEARRLRLPRVVLVYLADHDGKSAAAMREFHERLSLFSDRIPFEVQATGLNLAQIHSANAPKRPQFGPAEWELAALPPENLANLVASAVNALRDERAWDATIRRETGQRQRLAKLAATF
jgi:hypothetical protein